MSKRTILIGLLWVLCAGSVFGILTQHRQLALLRAQQEPSGDTGVQPSPGAQRPEIGSLPSSMADQEAHELLQLRNEVTKLSARKRELAGVVAEREDLRARLAQTNGNSAAELPIPPGYIRKDQAQFVGYSSPEATLQSFLSALQQHDVTSLLQALSPDDARAMGDKLGVSAEAQKDFFKQMDVLPGMLVKERQQLPDGSVELQVELMPGVPLQKLRLRPFDGQWKLMTGGFLRDG